MTAPLLMNETAYEVKKKIQFISTCDKGSNLTYEWRILKDNVSLSYNSSDGKLDFTPSSVGKSLTEFCCFFRYRSIN